MPRRYPRGKKGMSLVITIIGVLIYLAAYLGWLDPITKKLETSDPGLYPVVSYSDGDTITIDMHGVDEEIRFIGIDTPETHDPRKNVQCGGREASAYTKKRIGQFGKVRLASDPLSSNRDRYNRLLRYVYLPDGTFMNKTLVREGYAFAYTSFPFTNSASFLKLEDEAKNQKRGLWAFCKPYVNDYGGYTSNDL